MRRCNVEEGEGSPLIRTIGKDTRGAHQEIIRCCISDASGLIVSGSYDKTARIWTVKEGNHMITLEAHEKQVRPMKKYYEPFHRTHSIESEETRIDSSNHIDSDQLAPVACRLYRLLLVIWWGRHVALGPRHIHTRRLQLTNDY